MIAISISDYMGMSANKLYVGTNSHAITNLLHGNI